MRKKVMHIFMAAVTLVCAVGCTKFTADCRFVIRPRILRVQSSPPEGEAAYMVRVYSYYVPKNERESWAPMSYADADAGIIRNVNDPSVIRPYGFMGEQNPDDTYVHFTFSSSPIILVAVDPVNKFYAWRYVEYKIPLERMQITLRFLLWKSEARYKDSEWNVVNAALDEREDEGGGDEEEEESGGEENNG